MKRRTFLKAVGLGIGFIAMPSLAKPTKVSVNNHWKLKDALEKLFVCKDGNESAFIEFDTMTAHQWLTPNAFHSIYKTGDEVLRLTYQTFAYSIEGGDADEAEVRLAQYFYKEFKKIAEGDEKKMLIWRLKPEFKTVPKTYYGKTWMTQTDVEDRTDLMEEYEKEVNGRWVKRIRTLPYKPLEVPPNVKYDMDTMAYRYVEKETELHIMRMRLVIPEVMFDTEEYHPLARAEGSFTPRLEA